MLPAVYTVQTHIIYIYNTQKNVRRLHYVNIVNYIHLYHSECLDQPEIPAKIFKALLFNR